MGRLLCFLTQIFLFVSIVPSSVTAQVEMGVSITEEGLNGFYLGIGDYYNVPQKEVIIVRERRIPDDEIPIVFYLAKRAGVSSATIIKLRLSGKSWMDITFHFDLSAEIFYIDLKEVKDPPYGKAYGYYKKTPRKRWKKMVLADGDVVNLVNLKFLSEHYGYSPNEVIKMRAKGKGFVRIHENVRKAKVRQKEKAKVIKTREKKIREKKSEVKKSAVKKSQEKKIQETKRKKKYN